MQAGLAKWWSAEATSPAIRQGRLTVAEVDGEVVGMASVGREQDHLVLWRLYVLPEHHGQGIGSALLAAVLEEADGRYPEIRLSYTEGNTPAAHFYRSRGFVETHHEAGGGGVPDQVWMTRRAPAAARRTVRRRRPTPRRRPRRPTPRECSHDRSSRTRPSSQAAEQLDLRKRMREVQEAILARTPEHDLEPSLDRIAAVMELLGDPQRAFPVIHVTGTNGKTSTTRMIERLLREMGLSTGRFTSPAPARHPRADRAERRADPGREVRRGLRRRAAVHRDGRRSARSPRADPG